MIRSRAGTGTTPCMPPGRFLRPEDYLNSAPLALEEEAFQEKFIFLAHEDEIMDELHLCLPSRMRDTLDLPASVFFRARGHIVDLSTRHPLLFLAYMILLSPVCGRLSAWLAGEEGVPHHTVFAYRDDAGGRKERASQTLSTDRAIQQRQPAAQVEMLSISLAN